MQLNARTAFLILSFCAAAATAQRTASDAVAKAGSRIQNVAFGPTLASPLNTESAVELPSNGFTGSSDPVQVAMALAKQTYALEDTDISVSSSYATEHLGVTHVYLKQVVNNVVVSNADMNVNVDKDGNVVSYGSSFVVKQSGGSTPTSDASEGRSSRTVTPAQALATFARFIRKDLPLDKVTSKRQRLQRRDTFKLDNVPFAKDVTAKRSLLLTDSGNMIPTWELVVESEDNWFHAHVQADGSRVVSLNDWVADASYNVVQLGDNNPIKDGRHTVKDPAFKAASPLGWHDQGDKKFNSTIGNNVFAQENWSGSMTEYLNNKRPSAGDDLVFDNAADFKNPSAKSWIEAATTNLFYWNNVIHDLFYVYGFNEPAGNFQMNNFDKGGSGGDAVIAHAQDGTGVNNANFATPPDGQMGKMRMYIFTTTKPQSDSAFESDIIVHEYAHGLSNRLTGGPKNVNCLPYGQSGGMGEGWGDFIATLWEMKPTDKSDKVAVMGAWVNNGKTIRRNPYTTDMKLNPTTYGFISKGYSQVHATGEIWANILYEVYWSLHAAMNGAFNPDWYSGDFNSANTLMMQLVVDGMKLQPCRPTFVSARDAILQAEKLITGGKYRCALLTAFAKRGVGLKATTDGSSKIVEDFTHDCPTTETPTEPKAPEQPPTKAPEEEPTKPEQKPAEPISRPVKPLANKKQST